MKRLLFRFFLLLLLPLKAFSFAIFLTTGFHVDPWISASLTAGCLSGLGDVIAQWQQHQQEQKQLSLFAVSTDSTTIDVDMVPPLFNDKKPLQLDLARTQRFVMKGLGGGIIWKTWFEVADVLTSQLCPMDDVMEASATMIATRTVASILLDQFIASPVIIALWEIPVPMLLSPPSPENNSATSIPSQIQSKLVPLLVENAKVWTLANAIIYNLPLEYRVLASSCTDVLWQSILSSNVNTNLNDVNANVMGVEPQQDDPLAAMLVLGGGGGDGGEVAPQGIDATASAIPMPALLNPIAVD